MLNEKEYIERRTKEIADARRAEIAKDLEAHLAHKNFKPEPKFKTDCKFYKEIRDMNAYISVCDFKKEYCDSCINCPNFITIAQEDILTTEKYIEEINDMLFAAYVHGGDSGGPYGSEDKLMEESVEKFLHNHNLMDKYSYQLVTKSNDRILCCDVPQIIEKRYEF